MIEPTTIKQVKTKTPPKVYFIRVGEDEYREIESIAQSEDRSINKMANILIKDALKAHK